MEEDEEERDFSSDETAKIIEDDDMGDSPPDTPELWMPDRNDEDTNFVRGKRDAIPTKKYRCERKARCYSDQEIRTPST